MGATPVVPIMLDKERHLKFTLRSMIEIERKTGQNMMTTEGRIKAAEMLSNAEGLAFQLWTMLIHEDKKLTLEQVQDMITEDDLPTILDAMLKARGFAVEGAETSESDTDDAPLAQNRPNG